VSTEHVKVKTKKYIFWGFGGSVHGYVHGSYGSLNSSKIVSELLTTSKSLDRRSLEKYVCQILNKNSKRLAMTTDGTKIDVEIVCQHLARRLKALSQGWSLSFNRYMYTVRPRSINVVLMTNTK